MLKSIYGSITNPRTGESADILVKIKPNSVRDILIGGSLVAVGIAYLTIFAFKNGCEAYGVAELDALKAIDLIENGTVV